MNGYARLARTLMNQHGLSDWKIEWSRAKKTHGLCRYSTKTLVFSAVAFQHIGEAEVRDTILHEIAHALAGHRAGHGPEWRRVCLAIGGNGKQYVTREAAQAVPAAWVGTCRNGHTSQMHRAPLRVKACGHCSPSFRPENVYTWKQNGRTVPVGQMPDRYVREIVNMRSRYADRLPV